MLFQPIAADYVASAVADVAIARPVTGTIEIVGPDMFTTDEPVLNAPEHDHEAHPVIADPQAPYSVLRCRPKFDRERRMLGSGGVRRPFAFLMPNPIQVGDIRPAMTVAVRSLQADEACT
jgi:hypothetical protein